MNITLINLKKLFELKEKNNYKDKIEYFSNIYWKPYFIIIVILNTIKVLLGIIFIVGIFDFLLKFKANGLINIENTKYITSIAPIILTLLIIFITVKIILRFKVKDVFDDEISYFNIDLNELYVDPNNKEKIYPLYKLIKKYGLKRNKKDQENKYFLNFKLDTDINYKIFEKETSFKELSDNKCKAFFYEYIEPYIIDKDNIKSYKFK